MILTLNPKSKMHVICLIGLQLLSLITREQAPLLSSKVCQESTSLSLCCYALACEANMAATLRAFHAEYYQCCSDWLKLQSQIPHSPVAQSHCQFTGTFPTNQPKWSSQRGGLWRRTHLYKHMKNDSSQLVLSHDNSVGGPCTKKPTEERVIR